MIVSVSFFTLKAIDDVLNFFFHSSRRKNKKKERIKKRVTCPLAFLLLTFLFFCNDDVNENERTNDGERRDTPPLNDHRRRSSFS